jgi:hypothetical protein
MTRGRSGSLHLLRMALSSTTPRRFVPAHPRLLGRPLRTCRGLSHRRLQLPLRPISVELLLPSNDGKSSAAGMPFSVPRNPRPARLRTYASPNRLPVLRRKARYRPAGLSFGRTGFAPAGRLAARVGAEPRPSNTKTTCHQPRGKTRRSSRGSVNPTSRAAACPSFPVS